MSKAISRKSFLKGVAASALGAAAFGSLSPAVARAEEGALAFIPGTYKSLQTTPYATVEVSCTFSETALTGVSYEVIKTTEADYFTPFGGPLSSYCERIVSAGTTEGVDAVTGASLSCKAIRDGVNECKLQALGISLPSRPNQVLNPQDEDFTSFDGDLGEVLSPVKLGSMTIENRVVKAAGSPSPWEDKDGSKHAAFRELYGTMSQNGVGLILLAGGAIRKNGILPDGLDVEDLDAALADAAELVSIVHEGKAKLGYQMCFGGLAPTVPDSVINETPVEELDAYIDRVGISAERAKSVGFDCIEIKGASADALNGFLSRRINKREDEYGPQSIENRTRLFCRMIEKIKEVNGEDFPVGALINGVEENDLYLGDNDGFLTIEESKEIAKALVAAGADWIQLRVGATGQEMNIWAPDVQHIVRGADGMTGYGTLFDYSQHFEGMLDGSHSGFASFLPLVKAIKEVVDVPVGCAAYMDLRVGPDYLKDAIVRGDLDLVFMNRPLNCDPAMVQKLAEGRREDVVPCMKCMHCHDNNSTGKRYPSTCRMNPNINHSFTELMPEGGELLPATESRKVMVIGAGPAGMEAARVAAERGHIVTLYDSADRLGGLIPFARGVKGDHEHFDDYLAYISHQLEKNGVEIHLHQRVDADLVKQEAPDAVILAVGGKRESRVSGAEAIPVFSPEQAFGSEEKLGDMVAILGAGVQAVDFAAYLATMGKKLVLIHDGNAEDIDKGQSGWFKKYILPYLQAKGTKIWSQAEILAVEDGGVRFKTDTGYEKTVPCDSVVEFYNMLPNMELAEELEAAGFEVHAVGDCMDPHNIQQAVLSGNLAGRVV